MDRATLAHELRRYLSSVRGEEPPEDSATQSKSVTEGDEMKSSDENQDSDSEASTQRQRKLDELTSEANGCTKCALSENRTQVVFGEGSIHANVFVIGEAPGAQEDQDGRPFVGRAGELLRQGFEKVKINSNHVYITNTVKCRPPDNRDPRDDELESCRPYLDRQLELVDPDVVLALGSFAINYCLSGERGVGSSRGKVHEWNHRKLVATYHPAYILRNNNQAQAFIDDLKKVKDLMRR